MNEEQLLSIIQSEISQVYYIYLIDISSDKVYLFEEEKRVLSFFEFVQHISLEIVPEQINDFFSKLSTQKLKEEQGNMSFFYQKKKEYGGKNYFASVKLIEKESHSYILVMSKQTQENMISKDQDDSLKNKLKQISMRVTDTILKVFNTIDSVADANPTATYIKDLLNELVRDFPEFQTQLEKEMILQVNKGKDTLLVVDDDIMSRNLIKRTFSDQYEIVTAVNGDEAISVLEQRVNTNTNELVHNFVGIFLDLLMPVKDGFAVLDYLRDQNLLYKIPIIIISGTEDKETRQRVYQYNIADLLEKPFNLEIIKYRTQNLINLYRTSNSLNQLIMSQKRDLIPVVDTIAHSYCEDNKSKIDNIKKYVELLMREVAVSYPEYKLTEYHIQKIVQASQWYDIGFYLLPKSIDLNLLNSPAFDEQVRKHPNLGATIITQILSSNDLNLLSYAIDIALYHHESYDGSGYPEGIEKERIPIWAQATALAIEIDKLVEEKRNTKEEFRKIQFQNTKYNPKLLLAFEKIVRDAKL